MRKNFFAIFAMLALLTGCAPDDEQAPRGSNGAPASRQEAVVEKQADARGAALPETKAPGGEAAPETQPVSQAEYEKADKILAFANQARSSLEQNFSRPASHLRDNALSYLDTWHFAPMPKIAKRNAAMEKMTPPGGLFSVAEEQKLAEALAGMDRALDEMTGHYHEMEKYSADSRIRDDGKKGEQLGKLMAGSYAKFAANQHSWLEIVEMAAESAEEKFLRSHPLRRQIAGARSIFAQFREIAALINSGSASFPVLASLRQSIEEIVAECAKPPFDASPGLERLYRNFLAQTQAYCKTLNQAMAEGLHGAQKRELNVALEKCRAAYNEFVRQANFLTETLTPANGGALKSAN